MDGNSPIKTKPIGIVSAGPNGGEKGQKHFNKVIAYCKVRLMDYSIKAEEEAYNFDGEGNVVSDQLRGQIKIFL